MAMAPVENEPSLSNTGVNDVPALVVFHTPPAADATYHTVLSTGLTAMSATRPEVSAGPMERNLRPDVTALVRRALSVRGAVWAEVMGAAPIRIDRMSLRMSLNRRGVIGKLRNKTRRRDDSPVTQRVVAHPSMFDRRRSC